MNRNIDAKFFILSPDSESRKRIKTIVENEICEIYILDNHKIVSLLLVQFEKSVLVIDKDKLQLDIDFNLYISDILLHCRDKIVKIIIVSNELQQISDDKILFLKREEIINDKNILRIIENLAIWGQRNYIRFGNKESRIAFFRMKINENWKTGVIHDISASGMSCSFDRHSEISIHENNSVIEICIKDKIFRLSGNFLIRRTFQNTNVFVLVFSRKKSSEIIKSLNSIIYSLSNEFVLTKIEKLV